MENPYNRGSVYEETPQANSLNGEAQYDLGEIPQVTRSPNMNILHAMGLRVMEGTLDAEVFRDKLSSETLRFCEIFKSFLQIYQQAVLPAEIDRQAQKVFRSLEKYEKALEELTSYFDGDDPEIMRSGLDHAVLAINELTEQYELFITKQTPGLTKKCPDCGHPNPFGTIKCRGCQTIFILNKDEIPLEFNAFRWQGKSLSFSLGAAPFPGSLIEAYDNYDKLRRGVITKEKYLEELDWLITQLELSRQKLERDQYQAPVEVLPSTYLLFDGVDNGKKALEKLRDKIVWDRPDDLSQDWNRLLFAIDSIMEAKTAIDSHASN